MKPDRPSLDTLFELSRGHYETVAKWADSIDNKSVGLFGLMTFLIGAITAFNRNQIAWDWTIVPLLIAAAAFCLALVFVLTSFQTRQFILGYHPGVLLEDYAEYTPAEAKYWIMKHDGQNWEHNRQVLNDKADMLRLAILATGFEVAALVVWLIVA